MSKEHVSHTQIVQFAKDRVNLPKEDADEMRAQAMRLREKLEAYLKDNPDFSLKKMLTSGSLAKGTALKNLNDIDVACYVSGSDVPRDIEKLIEYLADKLRTAFPNFSADQVKPQTYSVTVTFKTSGLSVDIVPIIYTGDPDWYGELINQRDGSFLKTCIPRHLEFIRKRKSQNPNHFAQVVRLAKYWVKEQKKLDKDFRFKSFIVELIMAKLADDGVDFSDYPEALQSFFTYLAQGGLKEQIAFGDYYKRSKIPLYSDPVQVIDPVNELNNAAKLYDALNVKKIVDAAIEAGDAIDAATFATTKEKTVYYWQKVFGPTFQV